MSLLIGGFNRVAANNSVFIIFVASLAFLSIAFLAGWFNMVKKTIAFELDESVSSEDKAVKSFGLVKYFFPGVGEYFLPALGGLINTILFTLLVLALAFVIGNIFEISTSDHCVIISEYSSFFHNNVQKTSFDFIQNTIEENISKNRNHFVFPMKLCYSSTI